MLGWFAPHCPVDAAAKQWIEDRLHWLSQQFGRDTFTRRAVILPTSDFFPDGIDGTESSIRNLLDQVCGYMDADPQAVELRLFKPKNGLWVVNEGGKALPTGPGGLYDNQFGRTVIHISTEEMLNLGGLVGTMAHELAHLRLLGEGRLTGGEFDNELLTDLTVVFHGLGLFLGNSPRNWDGQYSTWPNSVLKRPEYMTPPMYGYALAHAAWLRGDTKPEWARFMSLELRSIFKQSLLYLSKTGDSKFHPE
jgi:hypothetical protein